MKTFLLTTAAALSFASASQAAIVRFDFQSPEMALQPDSFFEYQHDSHAFDRFDMFVVIDTDKVEGGRIDYALDGEGRPNYSAGIVEGYLNGPFTEMDVSFTADWQVSLYDIWYDTDGYVRSANNERSDSALYLVGNNAFWSGGPGTWTRTILEGELDTPAPVPLPAAGSLLMGALAGLGIMKRRRNKATA